MTPCEQAWYEDRARHGWVLPRKAAWPLRLPGIRFVRAFFNACYAADRAASWASGGVGINHVAPYDRWVIYAIARGWC